MLMGYSISSADMYPSMAMTGRTLQDPLGTMEDEVMVVQWSGLADREPRRMGCLQRAEDRPGRMHLLPHQ